MPTLICYGPANIEGNIRAINWLELAMQTFGVVDDKGEPIEAAFHWRSGRCHTDTMRLLNIYHATSERDVLHGRWLFGGILFPHFGHFLTESVHRLKPIVETPSNFLGVVFLKVPIPGVEYYDPLCENYVTEVLNEYFCIPREKIKLIERVTYVDDLVVQSQLQQLGLPSDPDYISFLGQIEKNNFAESRASPTTLQAKQKIFLSRRNYLTKGRMLGMGAIEHIFENNSFEIICPEEWSFREQIGMIRSAEQIACEAGSALHILDILGKQNSKLIVFSRRGFDSAYWKNEYSNRVRRFEAFDSVVPLNDYIPNKWAGRGHSLAHPRRLISFLRRQGLRFDDEAFIHSLRYFTAVDMQNLRIKFPVN